jgi:predicted dehydrogenase
MSQPEASTDKQARPLRLAVLGYGLAGRAFHAPLIDGVPGLELACICSSQPDKVRSDWPGVAVAGALQQVFDDPSIDVVVVATPNATHHALAKAALLAGKHVVVDKPCTVTLAETEDLLATARARGRVLTVYQNRRFDADFLALKQVLAAGQLGRVVHFESHFDRYRPQVLERWREQAIPGSSQWLDLGSHLLDQAIRLWGCPDDISLDLALQRDGTRVNDWFHAVMRYGSTNPGLRVVLHAGALVPLPAPRFAVHGTLGSFIKSGLDPQEDELRAGARPRTDALGTWGRDPQVGELVTYPDGAAGQCAAGPAPDVAGNYLAYYANLRDHLLGRCSIEVTPAQVRQLMALLERGEQSAREGRLVSTSDLK